MTFKERLACAAAQCRMEFSEAQLAAFDCYCQRLLEWNEKMNLTAITDPQEIAVKHMIDSLLCFDPQVFPGGASVIDVGTGAGFPGLPLRLWQEDCKLTLLDSLQKRVRFLQCVVDELRLRNVICLHGRAEEYGRDPAFRQQYDVAVSRAVARLRVLVEYCLPFVRVGGYFVALKGAKYAEEIEEAAPALAVLGGVLEDVRPQALPGTDDARAILYVRKCKDTPVLYPRKAGMPEKKPL